METKEINYKKVINSNIVSFLSYGILTGFIFILLVIIAKCAVYKIYNTALSISLGLIGSIIIFFLVRFVCRSSSYETLKKSKIANEYCNKFLSNMNLVFILCIIISILIFIGYIIVNVNLYLVAIDDAYSQYGIVSADFTNRVVNNIREEYYLTIQTKFLSYTIMELSLVTSFLTLIPYQKELLEKYNKSAD